MRERECWEALQAVEDNTVSFSIFLRFVSCFQMASPRHGNTIQDTLLNDRYIKKKKNFKKAVHIYIFDDVILYHVDTTQKHCHVTCAVFDLHDTLM